MLPQLLAVQMQPHAGKLCESKVVVGPAPLVDLEQTLGREGVDGHILAHLQQKVKPNEATAWGIAHSARVIQTF